MDQGPPNSNDVVICAAPGVRRSGTRRFDGHAARYEGYLRGHRSSSSRSTLRYVAGAQDPAKRLGRDDRDPREAVRRAGDATNHRAGEPGRRTKIGNKVITKCHNNRKSKAGVTHALMSLALRRARAHAAFLSSEPGRRDLRVGRPARIESATLRYLGGVWSKTQVAESSTGIVRGTFR